MTRAIGGYAAQHSFSCLRPIVFERDEPGGVGFGGLGDIAAKLAKAIGAEVTVFTRTREKLADAERLGVRGVLESDQAGFKSLRNSFEFMLSTVPEKHDFNPYVTLLTRKIHQG